MTLPEVADFLGVNPKTVRRLITRDACDASGSAGCYVFPPADLLRFVEARKE